jgi:hypothetical protein
MSYAFRLRFRSAKGFVTDEPTVEIGANAAGALVLSAAPGKKLRESGWFSVRQGGFPSVAAARATGEALRHHLLLAGTIRFMGFDFGPNGPKDLDNVANAHPTTAEVAVGGCIRNEIHGLDVFSEELPVRVFSLSATAFVTEPVGIFMDTLSRIHGSGICFSERQLLAMELINDSLFPASPDSQFLTRISAIEVLCTPGRRSEAIVTLISAVQDSLGVHSTDTAALVALRDILNIGKKESISNAIRRRVTQLLGSEAALRAKKLYDARSKLVHDGKGRGQTATLAADALLLACQLVKSDLGDVPPDHRCSIHLS